MGFTIPNYTNAVATGVGDQAEPDSVDFQILGNSSNGVVFDPTNYATNGAVTKTSTTSNTVNVAPYKVIIDGVYYHNDNTSITVALDGGDANKRFDLVVIPKATPLVPTFRKGTSSSTNPEFPVLVEGDIVLASIYRSGSGSAGFIDTPNIVDKRFFISSNTTWVNANEPTLVANSDGAKAANGDIWITTANAALGKSSVWIKSAGAWENLAEYTAISSANTANNLVLRDASGNFSAGTITASLTGNVSGNVSGSSGSTTGNAATATNANNANTVANLAVHGGRNNEQNKVVRTDNNGYLQTGYINSDSGYNENINSSPDRIWGSNGGGDSYLRAYRTSALNVSYATSAGSANTANIASSANSATSAISAGSLSAGGLSLYQTGTWWYTPNEFDFGGPIYYLSPGPSSVTEGIVRTSTGELKKNSASGVSLRSHKEDIVPMENALEQLSLLQPRNFRFKEEILVPNEPYDVFNRRTQLQYGFVMEEVQDAVPDLVMHRSPDGIEHEAMYWKESGMIALAIGAIQELSAKIDALQAHIEALEDK